MHSRSQKKHIQEIFHGPPLPAQHYLPTAISSSIEPLRYQEALQQQGIETLSQILLVITPSSSTVPSVLVKEDFSHEVFWSNLKRLQQIRKRLEIGKKKTWKRKMWSRVGEWGQPISFYSKRGKIKKRWICSCFESVWGRKSSGDIFRCFLGSWFGPSFKMWRIWTKAE